MPWRAAMLTRSTDRRRPRARGIGSASGARSLAVARGVRVALDLVEAELLDGERVLDREVAGDLGVGVVEVLVPGPQRDAQEVPLGPVDPLFGLAVVVDDRVARAAHDVEHGFGRVAVLHRVGAGRQLREVGLEPDRAVEPVEARLGVAELAGPELGRAEIGRASWWERV